MSRESLCTYIIFFSINRNEIYNKQTLLEEKLEGITNMSIFVPTNEMNIDSTIRFIENKNEFDYRIGYIFNKKGILIFKKGNKYIDKIRKMDEVILLYKNEKSLKFFDDNCYYKIINSFTITSFTLVMMFILIVLFICDIVGVI